MKAAPIIELTAEESSKQRAVYCETFRWFNDFEEMYEVSDYQFPLDSGNAGLFCIALEGVRFDDGFDTFHDFFQRLMLNEDSRLDYIVKPIPTWNSIESAAFPVENSPCAVPRSFNIPWRKIAMLDAGSDASIPNLTQSGIQWNEP